MGIFSIYGFNFYGVNKMSLAELRKQWEKGSKEIVAVIDPNQNVIVLLETGKNSYYIHRYFQIGEDWRISIDWNDYNEKDTPIYNLERALEFITNRFKRYIPA